ncbi:MULTISPECIES: SGNH/GDSL hydrolase family protein [Clostridium]|uniref:SGNH/GDSL hydrolase family protein n=1 Tax=Clostridium TaxID=1485 RepID=UPI0008250278|nr:MULTISPECIES: SGNH/GDSL hydrolase family protein [Clostridium]PJI09252.1 acetyl xylan esterase [Clostridium sp. CT7]
MRKKLSCLLMIFIMFLTIQGTSDVLADELQNVKLNNYNATSKTADVTMPNSKENDDIYDKALLIGRFDTSDPAGPKFAWSNTTIKAKFKGTGISVNFKIIGDNWFDVIIDGQLKTPIYVSETTAFPMTLASGLKNEKHTLELVKRTEAFWGEVQFLGLTVTDGKLLDPPTPSSRRIMFIGDSITCGYGDEGTDPKQKAQEEHENSNLAYGALTAKNLGADSMIIGWSGIGILRDCDGHSSNVMPKRYDTIVPYTSNKLWDSNKWTPKVIVINLGTNDFSVDPKVSSPIPDKTAFTSAYSAFLDHIRSQYPKAYIYCAIGPMLSGDKLKIQREYVRDMVRSRKSAGDNRIHFIEFPIQNPHNGYGEEHHPSLKTHALMASQLTEQIKDDLGW